MKKKDSVRRKRGPQFPIHDEIVEFAEKKDPSIIDKTCPTISGIILALNPKECNRYIGKIVERMAQSDDKRLRQEKLDRLYDTSVNEYIPKLLTDRKWIYSINEYIIRRLKNCLHEEAKRNKARTEKSVPIYLVDTETGEEYENPELLERTRDERNIEEYIYWKNLLDRAELSQKDKDIFICKALLDCTDRETAEEVGRYAPRTINDRYKQILAKLRLIYRKDNQ